MRKNKDFFIYSLLLIIFALFDVAIFVLNYTHGDFTLADTEDQLLKAIVDVIIIVAITITAVAFIGQVYLGIKGMLEANHPTGARAHIVIGKIFVIVNTVLMVICILSLFSSQNLMDDILATVTCALDAAIMFIYVKEAKLVKK